MRNAFSWLCIEQMQLNKPEKPLAVPERMVVKSGPGCLPLGCWATVLLKALKRQLDTALVSGAH